MGLNRLLQAIGKRSTRNTPVPFAALGCPWHSHSDICRSAQFYSLPSEATPPDHSLLPCKARLEAKAKDKEAKAKAKNAENSAKMGEGEGTHTWAEPRLPAGERYQ